MDALTSTEFRKTYASLSQPVRVTVNGHPIGIWTPAVADPGRALAPVSQVAAWIPNPEVVEKTAQAARDDLLRKINRSR